MYGSAQARSPMQLRELVDKYLSLTGSFGRELPLDAFGLDRAETERIFSTFDEDYHISRYFHFSCGTGTSYSINGFPQTHVSLDASIREVF